MEKDFKIWFPYEAFYIESMLMITRTAIAEQHMLRSILDEMGEGNRANKYLIIDLAQNIVSHVASISRYFWPSSKEKIHQQRGERLREAFCIDDSSPIKSRKVRNYVEHFDEKLDVFLNKSVGGTIHPSYIGDTPTDPEINCYFRAYFIDEHKFHALGSELLLPPIFNELTRVHELLERFNSNGGRLPME